MKRPPTYKLPELASVSDQLSKILLVFYRKYTKIVVMKFYTIIIIFFLAYQANSVAAKPTTQTKKHSTELSFEQNLNQFIKNLTPEQKTALTKRLEEEKKVDKNPYSLVLYRPTYILPFYYTSSPYNSVYRNADGKMNTPDQQKIMNLEFKVQISVQIPVVLNFFSPKNSLNVAYTQDSFWQVYTKSQFFRETNYEPELFFRRVQSNNLTWKIGGVHQSNGRGGQYERSWNRLYGEAIYSRGNWLVDVKPWILIFKGQSSDLHNPNIRHYLGNSRILFAYKLGSNTFSIMTRNNLQSGFKRGAEELTWSFPIHGHFRGYVDIFSGYGQSLIEYDHYTNAFAIGIDINDWI